MAVIQYITSGDDVVNAGAPRALDDGDFWGGSQLCGIAVALAAAVIPAQPAIAANDDIGTAVPHVEEDYTPVVVQPPIPWLRLYLPDPEELPAGSLFGVPEEDAWAPFRPIAQAPPVAAFADDSDYHVVVEEEPWAAPRPQAPAGLVQAFLDDDLALPQAAPQTPVDEDFWAPPVLTQQVSPLAFLADDDLPAAVAATPVQDEDFWLPPGTVTSWLCHSFLDTDDIVPQPTPGQPDEDYWTLGPAPVAAFMFVRLPYLTDPEEIPAGSLIPPVPPATRIYAIFVFDD